MAKISRKVLKAADEMVRTAEKIYNYRSDLIAPAERQAFREAIDAVSELKDDRENQDAEKLKTLMESLEKLMQKHGGSYYPKKALPENAEVFLVAAILAICIRMFFLQPFRIPTNSMYPTYNGMTWELYANPEDAPGLLSRPFRAVFLGSWQENFVSDYDGEVVIPMVPVPSKYGFYVPYAPVHSRKWFGLMPTVNDRYVFFIGGKQQAFEVPQDFGLYGVIFKRFGVPDRSNISLAQGGNFLYHTGVFVKKGESLLSFEIRLGDQLFVDRVSYHFRRPKVGEPIVFHTDNIPGMSERERGKYYIKRLAGTPGDVLQVKYPVLYRNGAPIEGAGAFEANAEKQGEYEGYLPRITSRDLVDLSFPYTVPQGTYIGLGDNSDDSADSRVWGPMPESALVGRALVIYYPFGRHFGAAK
jgi:signal peptidase I